MNSQHIANIFAKLAKYPDAELRIQMLLSELKKKKLLWMLPHVRDELARMRNREQEDTLIVESSDPLSEEERNRLREMFSASTIREKERGDLILGPEVYYRGKVYHGSVRWSLDQLRKRLSTLSKKVYED